MEIQFTPTPDEDTAAAVAAALAHVLEEEAGDTTGAAVPARALWSAAAVLAGQGLPAPRSASRAGWATAERTRREQRWSYGIVGM